MKPAALPARRVFLCPLPMQDGGGRTRFCVESGGSGEGERTRFCVQRSGVRMQKRRSQGPPFFVGMFALRRQDLRTNRMICSFSGGAEAEAAGEVFDPHVPQPLFVSHPEAQPAAACGARRRASHPRQPVGGGATQAHGQGRLHAFARARHVAARHVDRASRHDQRDHQDFEGVIERHGRWTQVGVTSFNLVSTKCQRRAIRDERREVGQPRQVGRRSRHHRPGSWSRAGSPPAWKCTAAQTRTTPAGTAPWPATTAPAIIGASCTATASSPPESA